MKHTTRKKPSLHGKKNYKHLAAAFAGAAIMSSVMLPGIPMNTVHAAAIPNVNASHRTLKTKLNSEANNLASSSQSKLNKNQTGKPLRHTPTASKQAVPSKMKTNKNQPSNSTNPNINAKNSTVVKATTPDVAKQSPDNTPPTDFKQVVEATATAYAPGSKDNDQWGNKTYMGTNIRPGVIAVDPSVIPLGSRVYLQYPDGHGAYAVAEDTGGAIKGSRIDVAKSTEDEASDFGIQKVKVYVVKSPTT
jgi:3D (Asp-Asp-Asp) domain-containing protein